MFQLHNLVPTLKKRKRIGRGGSRGGTSGRGHKGQKARSGGKVRIGFEGGQTPLLRRLPKRGFTNARHQKKMCIVTTDVLDKAFQKDQTVTKKELVDKGIIKLKRNEFCQIKLLQRGPITKALNIVIDTFSKGAKNAIEKAGGTIKNVSEENYSV